MMEQKELPAWYEVVRLHPDLESGNLARATFAIDFGGVLADSPGVSQVYRDSRAFWQATHLTSSMRRLLEEVLARLAGQPGDRVLQLRSPFGGGKSHVLVALYHAAKDRQALEEAIPGAQTFPDPGQVRVAGIDGEKFGPKEGAEVNGFQVHTLWGALGAQLGCFDLVREDEESRIAPGGDLVRKMLGDEPTLILLDEVLRYVERAMGIPVGDSNLGRQALDFLQTLTTEVAGLPRAVLVYSLQASAREAFENISLLNTLDHLATRVDAKREPVVGDEVLYVLKKRLLFGAPSQAVARQVAKAVADSVTQWKMAEAPDESSRRLVLDERVQMERRLEIAYPFHVALIGVMKERWASLPDFQRTRGALRFLATVLSKAKALGRRSILVGPGDIPLDDVDVRNAFFTEVGQWEEFQPVLEHDLIGPNARVRRIDERLARENPALSTVRPATRLATTILMYSFGGVQREEAGEILPPGVTERELLEACLVPGLDSITAQSVLKRLRDECLYLHYDGVRYCFKTVANVNKILEDEAENVKPEEIRSFLYREIDKQVGEATKNAIIWPEKNEQVPDREPRFLLVYMPLEFAEKSREEQDQVALDFLTQYGTEPRRYRNGLGLAVPERKELEGLRRAAKYLLAIDRVRAKRASYKLTKEQMDQLKEREATERSALEAGLRALYTGVWLLRMQEGQPALEKLDIGGRPLRAQGIHERLVELLTDVHGRLFATLRPQKMLTLLGIGLEEGERKGIETRLIRDTFFESPEFPRLTDERVLVETIAKGIAEGVLAYTLKGRAKEETGQYVVLQQDAVVGRQVHLDEIDLDSGLVLLPQCVTSAEGPETPTPSQGSASAPQPVEAQGTVSSQPEPARTVGRQPVTAIAFEMELSRPKLYKTFNVLGLLADKAGTIKVTVEAHELTDADPTWLRNAVFEPLEEAGINFKVKESQTDREETDKHER